MNTWVWDSERRTYVDQEGRPMSEVQSQLAALCKPGAQPALQEREPGYYQTQPHSAWLAVTASFFVPGLGSMLNEQTGKGVGILAAYILSCVLCFIIIGFILAPGVWVYGMVAANNDAHAWNRAHGIMS
jgi:TM2 domain-containing membrane protein YozV